MKLLLVEDEKYMAEALAQVLKKNHYAADISFNGEDGLNQGLTGTYDVIVLDIMLPKMNGLDVLKRLRAEDIDTPVILLTAKGEIEDKIKGLDCGADDYLTKPFDSGELLARLRALSRRGNELKYDGVLKCGNIELNPNSLVLRCAQKEITLTLKESQLLELMINRKGFITSKEMIIEKLWGYESDAEDNHVEVYISFLRKKLSHLRADILIETKRGCGYMLKDGKSYV